MGDQKEDVGGYSPRVEHLSIGLGAVSVVVLSLGAWFAQDLRTQVMSVGADLRSLKEALTSLDRRLAIMEAPGLDSRLRSIEHTAARNSFRLDVLERVQERQQNSTNNK